jgi:large subunit ribosomal protein L31e
MTNIIERNYVVPLRRGFVNTPKYKRTNKAVYVLREFMKKHMKSDDIKIGPVLNDFLWFKGIRNPPGKVSVIATKDKEGVVRVELTGHKYVDFKQQAKTTKSSSFKEKLQEKLQTKPKDESSQNDTDKPVKVKEEKASKEAKVKESAKEKEPAKTETKKVEEVAEESSLEEDKNE